MLLSGLKCSWRLCVAVNVRTTHWCDLKRTSGRRRKWPRSFQTAVRLSETFSSAFRHDLVQVESRLCISGLSHHIYIVDYWLEQIIECGMCVCGLSTVCQYGIATHTSWVAGCDIYMNLGWWVATFISRDSWWCWISGPYQSLAPYVMSRTA